MSPRLGHAAFLGRGGRRAPPWFLRVREMEKEPRAARRARLTTESVRLTREVMGALFRETRPLIERHLLDYPLPEIDPELFASPRGGGASERYLKILRTRDRRFRPKQLSRHAAVPPIIIVGTNRSAESLRMHALFTRRAATNQLENQRSHA